MITYRDRTFCNNTLCTNLNCDRRVTDKLFAEAEEFGLHLSISDFGTQCGGYRELNSDIKPYVDNLNKQEER